MTYLQTVVFNYYQQNTFSKLAKHSLKNALLDSYFTIKSVFNQIYCYFPTLMIRCGRIVRDNNNFKACQRFLVIKKVLTAMLGKEGNFNITILNLWIIYKAGFTRLSFLQKDSCLNILYVCKVPRKIIE